MPKKHVSLPESSKKKGFKPGSEQKKQKERKSEDPADVKFLEEAAQASVSASLEYALGLVKATLQEGTDERIAALVKILAAPGAPQTQIDALTAAVRRLVDKKDELLASETKISIIASLIDSRIVSTDDQKRIGAAVRRLHAEKDIYLPLSETLMRQDFGNLLRQCIHLKILLSCYEELDGKVRLAFEADVLDTKHWCPIVTGYLRLLHPCNSIIWDVNSRLEEAAEHYKKLLPTASPDQPGTSKKK